MATMIAIRPLRPSMTCVVTCKRFVSRRVSMGVSKTPLCGGGLAMQSSASIMVMPRICYAIDHSKPPRTPTLISKPKNAPHAFRTFLIPLSRELRVCSYHIHDTARSNPYHTQTTHRASAVRIPVNGPRSSTHVTRVERSMGSLFPSVCHWTVVSDSIADV